MKERSLVETDEIYLLVRKVLRLARRFQQALDEPLESVLHLNIKELLVLAAIMDGCDTPTAVAGMHSLPAPTVTRLVTKLVEAGLVRRVTDPADLRRQRLELTGAGETVRQHARQTGQRIMDEQFSHLDLEQVRRAVLTLHDLEASLFPAPAKTKGGKAAAELELGL